MSEVSLGAAQPQKPKKAKQPKRRSPQSARVTTEDQEEFEDRAAAAEPVDARSHIPQDLSGQQVPQPAPANPYLVTGWRTKQHVEFDVTLPSGQVCRVRRLDRDDLLRMDLMQYLDTFTPMLLEDSISDIERERQMTDIVKEKPEALQKMLKAIDMVVMSACVKPKITEDPDKVNYGSEFDWGRPDFTPVALLSDIDTFERMYIFGQAFGRDMDDLKSVFEQAQGMASLANQPGVQQNTQ